MIVAVAVAVLPAVGGAVRVAKATWCLRWRPRRRRSPLTELKAERARQGIAFTRADLYAAIMGGAVERVRPKMMTVAAIMAGLLPIMWSHGTGAEVMQRIAVPMIGGMVSSTLLTLIVIPSVYAVIKGFELRRARKAVEQRA